MRDKIYQSYLSAIINSEVKFIENLSSIKFEIPLYYELRGWKRG